MSLYYDTYSDGTIYLNKIKGDPLDFYRCSGCWKMWKSTAKKMGHKEAACKKNR
jgi:hypothetical protein